MFTIGSGVGFRHMLGVQTPIDIPEYCTTEASQQRSRFSQSYRRKGLNEHHSVYIYRP